MRMLRHRVVIGIARTPQLSSSASSPGASTLPSRVPLCDLPALLSYAEPWPPITLEGTPVTLLLLLLVAPTNISYTRQLAPSIPDSLGENEILRDQPSGP